MGGSSASKIRKIIKTMSKKIKTKTSNFSFAKILYTVICSKIRIVPLKLLVHLVYII